MSGAPSNLNFGNFSFAVRFRPVGPWRFGPDSGARDRVDLIYHSDALFSAVCSAMSQLGLAEEWLEATATSASAPAVRFSSFFPFIGDTLLVVPPRSLWPPPESTKIRYKGAHFVPLPVIESLLSDKGIDEDRWAVDGESECLVLANQGRGPFRVALRSSAGVDRLQNAAVEIHSTACLEFTRAGGLWTIVQFADEAAVSRWQAPVRSALLLLADSGLGGERSRGWGRSEAPEWQAWTPPQATLQTTGTEQPIDHAHWLLSLYTPAENDAVDWKRGNYATVSRRGRIESSARWGEPKRPTTMIAEGSVLLASNELLGAASNVAPEGFPHPVYRARIRGHGSNSLAGGGMNYRLTCLTPTLVGDGQRLSPIDYMVWKDHVNVLDQWRIFRLLAKGPRLESYLTQLKKADKLDFASWGGFAQNYAGRRIPFEHPSSTQYWERTHAEHLFIPTFSTGPSGPYLPGTAIKGAFRTGVVHGRLTERFVSDLATRIESEGRMPRRPAISVEESALGPSGADPLRVLSAYDSKTVPVTTFKIYLLRTSTLESRGGSKFELAWKQIPRGNVKRAEDSTPVFAEMAAPGSVFEGEWHQNAFLSQPEIGKALRRRAPMNVGTLFELVNAYTEQLLSIQKQYAEWTGLALLKSTVEQLEARLTVVREAQRGCVLPLGWGAGFLSKVAILNTQDETYRGILRQVGLYARAIQSGLPFPKTRRIVFLGNQPASLPGFVHLEVTG